MTVPVKRSLAKIEAENVRLRRELANTKLNLEVAKSGGIFREGVAVK